MSLRTFSALLLHAGSAAIMYWGFDQLSTLPQDKLIVSQKGGHLQFLTIQGLGAAFLCQSISALSDIMPSVTVLAKLKRNLFMIAMPIAVVISSIYWTLLLLFPALILQRDASELEPTSSSEVPELLRIPVSMDLALHAVPAVTLLFDFYLFETKFSSYEVKQRATIVAATWCLWYSSWVEYCASYNGSFPYPFLTENPFPVRCGIYFGALVLALAAFRGINSLHP
ncbi:hypothetical protein PUNSTDRAFT_89781 [Punctularia strigosozonata HHB-11173 SS5]|uniref:uncharacterized protein n=1 Tax=Punctularia strigosozonata (strain HHB-11173) TaxID=741275 RepID=UPI000441813F|nr:uncharacterized protein PUNSTDRAFT_89781 [Punctularia strigosozonata HHB-11173 SS5]EIN07454.1 hypothetical protein PUNSTDRAFT_89781 [Punctularia strigosozonata HHB-11173 SS5]